MDKELFTRFLNNQCTTDEVEEVIKWLQDDAITINGRAFLKQIWNDFPQTISAYSVDYERILDSIHHGINLGWSIKRKSTLTPMVSRKKGFMKFISALTKIAAILFIPLFLYFIYNYTKEIHGVSETMKLVPVHMEISSPKGSKTYLQLPDGSKVWLNHDSRIKFPQSFTGNTRTVELNGEAYFEVVDDEQKPFIVTAGEIYLLVKGTEFNVMAYPEDAIIETTLKSGELTIQRETNDGNIQRIFEMKPNHHVTYFKKEKELIYSIENPDKYISWKDDILMFRNDSLHYITNKLSRWYNVDIQLKDNELSKYTFTATFSDETLSQILELLSIAAPIKYTISSWEKLPDGTFTRRKVVIQHRLSK